MRVVVRGAGWLAKGRWAVRIRFGVEAEEEMARLGGLRDLMDVFDAEAGRENAPE